MPSSLTPYSTAQGTFCTSTDTSGNISVVSSGRTIRKTLSSHDINRQGDGITPQPFGYSVVESVPLKGLEIYWSKWDWWLPAKQALKRENYLLREEKPYTLDSSDDAEALTKCLAKVVSLLRDSDVNIGATIGEGRETYSMLRNIHSTAGDVIRNARRALKRRDWRKAVGIVGELELLNSLGVQPLLADVNALQSHVIAGRAESVYYPFKARASVPRSSSKVSTTTEGDTVITWTETMTGSTRCELGGRYVINDLHSFENWRAGVGFRPSTVWELITMSWLLDYFLKVGEFLELMEAALLYNGFSLVDSYKTQSLKRDSEIVASALNSSGNGFWLYRFEAKQTKTHKVLERTLISSLPAPTQPVVKIPKASTQLLNCAGLLSQLLKK